MTDTTGPGRPSEIVTCPNCGKRNRVPAAVARGMPRCGNCRKPLPWLTTALDHDFDEVAGKASVPVLVDLWAPWCGPCRMIAPGIEQAARTLAGRLKAVKVNVDDAPRVAARYQALSIPTVLVLRDGVEIARQVGAVPPPALLAWVRDAIGERSESGSSGGPRRR
jgi:thioredoxin 2